MEIKNQLLNKHNRKTLIERLEIHSTNTPQKCAVKINNIEFSYEYVNKHTNKIANKILDKYDNRFALSNDEKDRYKRQMILNGWGIESQEKLKSTKVFVAGAGGSGSPLIIQLALLGFGTIVICDFDSVELTNLNRQCLHDESRIGMNKAISARISVNRINPNVNVIACTEKITRNTICEIIGDSAIIFDNVDDLETKFILSEYAVHKQIPHIISSMIETSSYVAVFHSPKTPCLHCIYDVKKIKEIDSMRKGNKYYKKQPIPVSSPALFLSTGFACNEALKIILGTGEVAYNRYFFFNQNAISNLANTDGFKAITYPFNSYFKEICKEQGFDWDKPWNGKFVEEIKISHNTDCPICPNKEKKSSTNQELDSYKQVSDSIKVDKCIKVGEKNPTVAILVDDNISILISVLSAIKSCKSCIHMDTTYSQTALTNILKDSEARIILTNDKNIKLALQLVEKTNRNIEIINIDEIHKLTNADTPICNEKKFEVEYMKYIQESNNSLRCIRYNSNELIHLIEFVSNKLNIKSSDNIPLLDEQTINKQLFHMLCGVFNGATAIQDKSVFKNYINEQEQYWKKKLKNINLTNLVQYNYKSIKDDKLLYKTLNINDSKLKEIENYCERKKTPLFNILLAVYNIVIQKEVNQNDISIMVPILGHKYSENTNYVGSFLNFLTILTTINIKQSFKEYLNSVNQVVNGAMTNQDYPIEGLNLINSNSERLILFSFLSNSCSEYKQYLEFINKVHDIDMCGKSNIGLYAYLESNRLELILAYKKATCEEEVVERILRSYNDIIDKVLDNELIIIKDIYLDENISFDEMALDFNDQLDNEDMLY